MNLTRFSRRGFTSIDLVALLACVLVLTLLGSELLFGQAAAQPGSWQFNDTRVGCVDNLRSILQSMTIYAQSNQAAFPCTPGPDGATYFNAPQEPQGYQPTQTAGDVVADWYGNGKDPSGSDCGDPFACLWLIVLTGQETPKTFICPSDTIARGASLEYANPTPLSFFGNFGVRKNKSPGILNSSPNIIGQGESYSIDDPWLQVNVNNPQSVFAPGGWWINDNRADQPILSDMAPADIKAAGKFNRETTQSLQSLQNFFQNGGPDIRYLSNSGNHNGDGQNVGFADGHVEWDTNPYVGEQDDNIFTYNPLPNPNSPGNPLRDLGTKAPPFIQTPLPPFDTCMIPVRNVKSGQW